MKFKTLDDVDVQGKRVIVRVDFDVPIKDGIVTDFLRLNNIIPTVQRLVSKGAKVILIGHSGRPKGKALPEFTLAPIVKTLSGMLKQNIEFVPMAIGEAAEAAVEKMQNGQIVALENLRYYPGEEANDHAFAAGLAKLGDIYVNDAFANSHRPHASMALLPTLLLAVAGPIVQAELTALDNALEHPQHPVMAIAGGSKISTKLALLGNLVPRVDKLVLGGAMANTFLHAQGVNVGASMHEADMADEARRIMALAKEKGCEIILPTDAVVATMVKPDAPHRTCDTADVKPDEMLLDIGPQSMTALKQHLDSCKTLLWNGPLGVFEVPPFDHGTVEIAQYAAALTKAGKLLSVAGGGDTAAAMNHAKVSDDLTYISVAGGAFLEWLEGKTLPGVAVLLC